MRSGKGKRGGVRSLVRVCGGPRRSAYAKRSFPIENGDAPTFEKLLAALPMEDRLFFESYSADRRFPLDRAAAACVVFFVSHCRQAIAEAEKRNGD